jgi:GAF domain-containing protein
MTPAHKELLQELQSYAPTAPTAESLMRRIIAKRLHEKMTRYNWTGFYLRDPADAGYLIAGPYTRSFTPNARIPLNTGLCGAAATSGSSHQPLAMGNGGQEAQSKGRQLQRCDQQNDACCRP